jgi:hypothetical protein
MKSHIQGTEEGGRVERELGMSIEFSPEVRINSCLSRTCDDGNGVVTSSNKLILSGRNSTEKPTTKSRNQSDTSH